MLFSSKGSKQTLLAARSAELPSIARLIEAGDNADAFIENRLYIEILRTAAGEHEYHAIKTKTGFYMRKMTGDSPECFVMRKTPSGNLVACRMEKTESPLFQAALIKAARLRK